ncbi:MAG TPA: exodeoxyribonuclease III [Candidatus Saccharimonadales bacterium]|nr:exodeoxyribonuclease III [Candidatus Saccharimonadales bacterium]
MIKLYSWNVNGIRAVQKKGVFEPFVRDENPDIVCLQETKAKQGQAIIDLPNYTEYWNSAERAGYSGTAIFSKHPALSVAYGLPEDIEKQFGLKDDGYGDPNKEGRVVTAEYEQFFVVTVYTPNAKDDLSRVALREKQWDPAFLAYCKQLEARKPVVFCGDLNVAHTELDLANPKPNVGKKGFTKEERAGFQNFIDAGFIDTFRLFHEGNGYYTWWSHFANARARNVGWRIDYILVSASLKDRAVAADIHPKILGSDHCPVSVTLDI